MVLNQLTKSKKYSSEEKKLLTQLLPAWQQLPEDVIDTYLDGIRFMIKENNLAPEEVEAEIKARATYSFLRLKKSIEK